MNIFYLATHAKIRLRSSVILLFVLNIFSIDAIPPKPSEGFRWILNHQFSDEFNDTKLNKSKWYDYHPNWKGRAPAIFLPSQVTLADGMMQIKNIKLPKDTVIRNWNGSTTRYSIGGGAVVSRTRGAFYGYYECRLKASQIKMSSTFWMSNGSSPVPGGCTSDNYSLELDILECIGGATTNQKMKTHMNSNTHFWYRDCDGNRQTRSAGSAIELSSEVWEDFHTYGAWWIDAKQVKFYADNKFGNTIKFNTSVMENPFDRPQQINMVTETYDWQPAPSAAELADNTKNTTYYDWIRSYKLVDADHPVQGTTETLMFDEMIDFEEKPNRLTASTSIELPILYMANADRDIQLELRTKDSILIGQKIFRAYAGYALKKINLNLDSIPAEGSYLLNADIRPTGSNSDQAFDLKTIYFDLYNPVDVNIKVVDALNGLPLDQALISIDGNEKYTGINGDASYSQVNVGQMPVSVHKEGYQERIGLSYYLLNDTTIQISLEPISYSVTLQLKDIRDQSNIRNAEVKIESEVYKSDVSGRIRINLFGGDQTISIFHSSYGTKVETIRVTQTETIVLNLKKQYIDASFIIKKNILNIYNAKFTMGNETKTTSSLGRVKFTDLKTDSLISFSINYKNVLYLDGIFTFNSDTFITIDLATQSFDVALWKKISVFPNPAGEILSIEGYVGNPHYAISNLEGKVLKEGTLEKNQLIDIKNFEPGSYIIMVDFNQTVHFIKI